ncbi:MAG: OmpA family protein [Cytophagaceae bacterium]
MAKYLILLQILVALDLQAQDRRLTLVTFHIEDFDKKTEVNAGIEIIGIDGRKSINGMSDSKGIYMVMLEEGGKYHVLVKQYDEVFDFGVIVIPFLKKGDLFHKVLKIKVDAALIRSYILENVYFDTNKSDLKKEALPALEELFSVLNSNKDIHIEICGHTDNSGNEKANHKLSQQRAEAVRQWLIKKGIDPGRLSAKGFGADEPIADNATIEGMQLNRRIEINVFKK